MVGFGFEAFVFVYLGLTVFSYIDYYWSWQFILIEIVVLFFGRLTGTVGLMSLLTLFGHKMQVSWKELLFIGFAGMIRGAIALGLVLQIDNSIKEREVIITTSLVLVICTTLFYGSFMPVV